MAENFLGIQDDILQENQSHIVDPTEANNRVSSATTTNTSKPTPRFKP
jgi:hypothetical protein